MTRSSLSLALMVASASAATVAVLADSSEICPTLYADFHRRQLADFSPAGDVFVYVEGESAKHIPFLALSDDGKTGTVIVGNGDEEGGVYHPMVASEDPGAVHYVTHILVKDQDGNVVVTESLDPTVEAPAKITFDVPAGVTELIPYEWCNLHGLWKGESVPLPTSISEERSIDAVCSISDHPKAAWPSVHADFLRQQKSTFESDAPFSESDGEKHTPYISLKDDGSTASILVGKIGGAIHPMNGTPDGSDEEPHWITEIYVVDQDGAIVTMHSLDPTDVDVATMDFEIPKGAETLKAYAWCNIHGLWEGPEVEVETVSTQSDGAVAASVSTGFAFGATFLAVLNM